MKDILTELILKKKSEDDEKHDKKNVQHAKR